MILLLALLLYPSSFDLELDPNVIYEQQIHLEPNHSIIFDSNCTWVTYNQSLFFNTTNQQGTHSCSLDFFHENVGIRSVGTISIREEFQESFSWKRALILTFIILLVVFVIINQFM